MRGATRKGSSYRDLYSRAFLSEKQLENASLYSIIDLSSNELGNVSAHKFFQSSFFKNGEKIVMFDGYKVKELFDALIYVGQYDTLKRCLIPAPSFDKDYFDEVNRRRKIFGMKLLDKGP